MLPDLEVKQEEQEPLASGPNTARRSKRGASQTQESEIQPTIPDEPPTRSSRRKKASAAAENASEVEPRFTKRRGGGSSDGANSASEVSSQPDSGQRRPDTEEAMELENGISAKTGAETHGTKPRARAGPRSRMSSRQKASAEVENAVDAEPSSTRSLSLIHI